MQYLPNVIGAGFVFFVGFMVAKVVRQLVETALRAANVDRYLGKLSAGESGDSAAGAHSAPAHPTAPPSGGDMPGAQPTGQFAAGGPTAGQASQNAGAAPAQFDQPAPTQPQWTPAQAPVAGPRRDGGKEPVRISSIVGSVLFGIILIVVGIVALQILSISAISDPAEEMLNIILNAIPLILAAGIILGVEYVIARFVGGLLEPALRAAGTDRAANNLELLPEGRSASSLLTIVAKIAIMMFFAVAATRMLGFPEITAILDEVLRIGGRVLFGVAIIAAGYLIAQVISRMFDGTARQIAKYGILVLFAAIGLRYMGLADSIVNLAFGALVVSAGLAAALAFGTGGRDAAARRLQRMEEKAD
ncbi:MAG: mechanosensitive ion channel [Cumulibacter sp.]